MAEQWFSEQELVEMSRPTMDRAIEAIDRGDLEQAKRALCEEMKHEWRCLHDLMAGGMAGLISFVQARMGDEAWGRRGATALSAAGSARPAIGAATGGRSCTRSPPSGGRTRAAAPARTRARSRSRRTTRSSPSG